MRLRLGFLIPLLLIVAAVFSAGTSADPAIDAEEQDFLHRINAYRAENGLGPVALQQDLNEASDWFSIDMAMKNYFPADHISQDGRNPGQRVADFGYTGGTWGENIAAGHEDGEATFIQWKNSPPHNKNMLSANYNLIGIARAFDANSKYKWYWTTDFGFANGPVDPPATPTPPPGQTPAPTPVNTPAPTPGPPPEEAIVNLIGCNDNNLPATDDGLAPQFTTSFPLNFFGATYNAVYPNNNGNITFDSASGTYTPFGLQGAAQKIIAPFFADVDTEGAGSGLLKWGNGVYSGNRTFCANWIDVGYYNNGTDKRNSFQLLLVERADQGAGDFDIMMNIDKVKWEVGNFNDGTNGADNGLCAPDGIQCQTARMGYSNGSDNSYEYPGSGIPGRFLDSNPNGLVHNSENSLVEGRYVYFVRNGAPATGGTMSGKVFARSNAPANVMAGAPVQICGAPGCYTALTNDQGEFVIRGLEAANYNLRVFPGNDAALFPQEFGPFTMAQDGSIPNIELVLQEAKVPPLDTTITARSTSGQIPMVYWGDELTLRTTGCPGGTASYQVIQNGNAFRSDGMSEGPAGQYTGTIPSLAPVHGQGSVRIEIACPGGPPQVKDFNIYIDPSGNVRTVDGDPIVGARVTLSRSDTENGVYVIVPNGDPIMSPANRTNPDSTDGDGHFGWDVIAGFYKVRAEKPGCVSPEDSGQAYAETDALEIPPPVFDLDIRLACAADALPFTQGDVDCNRLIEGFDALQVLYYSAGFNVTQLGACPQLGLPTAGIQTDAPVVVGDVDCDGDIDAADALGILRGAAGKPLTDLPTGCHVVGQ